MIGTKFFLFLQCHYAALSPFVATVLIFPVITKLVIFLQFGKPGNETLKPVKL